ncbi:unnamed protein product, partial [Brachionus calyciflorus]
MRGQDKIICFYPQSENKSYSAEKTASDCLPRYVIRRNTDEGKKLRIRVNIFEKHQTKISQPTGNCLCYNPCVSCKCCIVCKSGSSTKQKICFNCNSEEIVKTKIPVLKIFSLPEKKRSCILCIDGKPCRACKILNEIQPEKSQSSDDAEEPEIKETKKPDIYKCRLVPLSQLKRKVPCYEELSDSEPEQYCDDYPLSKTYSRLVPQSEERPGSHPNKSSNQFPGPQPENSTVQIPRRQSPIETQGLRPSTHYPSSQVPSVTQKSVPSRSIQPQSGVQPNSEVQTEGKLSSPGSQAVSLPRSSRDHETNKAPTSAPLSQHRGKASNHFPSSQETSGTQKSAPSRSIQPQSEVKTEGSEIVSLPRLSRDHETNKVPTSRPLSEQPTGINRNLRSLTINKPLSSNPIDINPVQTRAKSLAPRQTTRNIEQISQSSPKTGGTFSERPSQQKE